MLHCQCFYTLICLTAHPSCTYSGGHLVGVDQEGGDLDSSAHSVSSTNLWSLLIFLMKGLDQTRA